MKKSAIFAVAFLGCAASLTSKDKGIKVPYHEMAVGMRDAFNCGVVVEQYLHGPLKGKDDDYHAQREKYNCDHVEAVLNTLPDQGGDQGTQ